VTKKYKEKVKDLREKEEEKRAKVNEEIEKQREKNESLRRQVEEEEEKQRRRKEDEEHMNSPNWYSHIENPQLRNMWTHTIRQKIIRERNQERGREEEEKGLLVVDPPPYILNIGKEDPRKKKVRLKRIADQVLNEEEACPRERQRRGPSQTMDMEERWELDGKGKQ
jgi:hypothetical protein